MNAPEYSAGVESWTLASFVGRKVWAKPYDSATTLPAEWVELKQVWMEELEDTTIVGVIDWHGTDTLARWLITNRVQVELTEKEHPGSRELNLGGDYRIRSYDPWDPDPMERITHRHDLPQPAPEHVVAVPVRDAAHYIGRRTRVLTLKEPKWPRISSIGETTRRAGYQWVRVDHDDGKWGSHRADLWFFVEVTPEEYADAVVKHLGHGYGTYPLLDRNTPPTVSTPHGDQHLLF